jgi:Flp pilus assembly protein TadG
LHKISRYLLAFIDFRACSVYGVSESRKMYQFMRRIPNTTACSRFVQDRSGNVAIIFGFSVLTLFASVGGAIDYARWYGARTKMQSAMDSASLAGGRALQLTTGSDYTVGTCLSP